MGTRYSENFTEVHTSGFGVTATLSWPGSWEEILTGVAFTDYLRFGALAMERQGFVHMRVLFMISTLNFISSQKTFQKEKVMPFCQNITIISILNSDSGPIMDKKQCFAPEEAQIPGLRSQGIFSLTSCHI